MKSKLGNYRIITAPKGRYRYQFQPNGSTNWLDGSLAFEEITLEDCEDYILDVTLNRTFSGFQREKSVVYDNLSKVFPEIEFVESDSDLDHSGDIDYIGLVRKDFAIGIQIKPITGSISFSGWSPTQRMKANFDAFTIKYGGPVFVIFSEHEEIINK